MSIPSAKEDITDESDIFTNNSSIPELFEMPKNNYPALEIKAWGDFAHFTGPDMKVERAGYSVMPPLGGKGSAGGCLLET